MMLYKCSELHRLLVQMTFTYNDRVKENLIAAIDNCISEITHMLYCYGCIVSTINREKKIFEVSIPKVCELNKDGTDPLFEHTNTKCYITQSEMISEIRRYLSLITTGATLAVTIRDEIWTADKYKQYANKEEKKWLML